MPKTKISLKFLMVAVALICLCLALHNYTTTQLELGWNHEQAFIAEDGVPEWEDGGYYPNLAIESSSLWPEFFVAIWPCTRPEIFNRVTCLDTTTVSTWVGGYERCSVFKSVREIRLVDSECDTPRLALAFAQFPKLHTVEIHTGWGSDGTCEEIENAISKALPNVKIRRITK